MQTVVLLQNHFAENHKSGNICTQKWISIQFPVIRCLKKTKQSIEFFVSAPWFKENSSTFYISNSLPSCSVFDEKICAFSAEHKH